MCSGCGAKIGGRQLDAFTGCETLRKLPEFKADRPA
jgi:hypothetical protein